MWWIEWRNGERLLGNYVRLLSESGKRIHNTKMTDWWDRSNLLYESNSEGGNNTLKFTACTNTNTNINTNTNPHIATDMSIALMNLPPLCLGKAEFVG